MLTLHLRCCQVQEVLMRVRLRRTADGEARSHHCPGGAQQQAAPTLLDPHPGAAALLCWRLQHWPQQL